MVPLPRRLAAVLIALIATVSIAGTALGSPADVINDFRDNGAIDACHSEADYEAARGQSVDSSTYGDFQGALDVAVATPALVGSAATPCSRASEAEGGSSTGSVAVVVVAIAVGVAALILFAIRRRRGDDDTGGPGPIE